MSGNSRIEELRRRVQKDPASIAFAQLAEECRRAGHCQEAIDVCRSGLAIHPGYLSARVTLGRALLALNQLDEAKQELQVVLDSAPDNLAALRGVAEISLRSGRLADALAQFRAALAQAKNDPELQQRVSDLTAAVAEARGPELSSPPPTPSPERDRARTMIAALEQWLAAIHVARAERHA